MSALQKQRFTPDQYREIERNAPYKSEYLSGEMFAMAGSSPAHSLITANIIAEVHSLLKGRPCRTYSSNLRVQVSATGLYTYPDVIVVCGEGIFGDSRGDTLCVQISLVRLAGVSPVEVGAKPPRSYSTLLGEIP